ncbi:IPT/TIG domain-containing protein [Actinoplanes sp. DH11]|uniref:IPT/TIG domain-containing protein n=1 Tax=Actinoplanes sp. DH11 TaxID=2857011 RepID=UPI001E4F652B|nr:IPT/TIG domain-containing protein [Actinoplanes sp. DH11]
MSAMLRSSAAVAAGVFVIAGAGAAAGAVRAAAPPLPAVSGITPAKVSTAGGTTVTITGRNFTEVTAVTFGGAAATSYTVTSITRITAVVPEGSSGAAPVTVTAAGGESPAGTRSVVTYRTPLGIDTSANPVAKASGGPVILTVTGGTLGATAKDFGKEAVSVLFNNRRISALHVDENRLKITVPATAADSAQVSVLHDTVAGEPATITLAPVVTSLSVKTATVAGGVRATIRAAGANIAEASDFRFGDNPAECTRQGSTLSPSFVCVVPASDEAGPVAVTFTSGSGTPSRFTAAATFSYTDN